MNSLSQISSGSKANLTGSNLEGQVENLLVQRGYQEFKDYKDQLYNNRAIVGGRQYTTQAPVGETIYSTKRRCDFLVFNKDKFENDLIIECKWQQSSGSVDEKYPFLYHNIMRTGIPSIIILDGSGYKPTAKKWLNSMVSEYQGLIGVYSLLEFIKKINQGFLD